MMLATAAVAVTLALPAHAAPRGVGGFSLDGTMWSPYGGGNGAPQIDGAGLLTPQSSVTIDSADPDVVLLWNNAPQGAFQIQIDDDRITGDLAYDATAGQVQTALTALGLSVTVMGAAGSTTRGESTSPEAAWTPRAFRPWTTGCRPSPRSSGCTIIWRAAISSSR